MKCTVNGVLKIAKEEIGYREKKSNKSLDSKTANYGSGNYTKYGRDIYSAGYWNGNKNGYDWCTTFVAWCILKACNDNTSDSKYVQPYGTYGASCKWQTKYYTNAGLFYSTPKVGDQAFFTRGHTGLVESFTGNRLTLIEGNSNNRVERRTYTWPNSQFSGFGRPRYSAETVKPSISRQPSSSTVKAGDSVLLSVKASGTDITYQWEYSKDGGKTYKNFVGGTGATIAFSMPKSSSDANLVTLYRCVVKNEYGTVTSEPAKVSLYVPSFKSYKASVTPSIGLNVRTGAGVSYKKLGALKKGTIVTILEEKSKWGRINFKGSAGWISLAYVKKV